MTLPEVVINSAPARTPGVVVSPGQGLGFDQVDFTYDLAVLPDSDWGLVSNNAIALFEFTGYANGYIVRH
jgi:hypothetical protein